MSEKEINKTASLGNQPTQEEIDKMRENMVNHIETELPLLEKQARYEKLLCKIEEYRTRKTIALYERARFFAAQNPTEEEPAIEGPKRKLKTD